MPPATTRFDMVTEPLPRTHPGQFPNWFTRRTYAPVRA